jgi:putative transposase
MDGRGRALDNIFTERLWRSVKYEEVYLNDYLTPKEAWQGLSRYFDFYNYERPHQALDYLTPAEVYFKSTRFLTNGTNVNQRTLTNSTMSHLGAGSVA